MNPDSTAQKLRTRLLIAVSIVCGSLAAGLMWQSSHRVAPFGLSEDQVRKAGFKSADEFQSLSDDSAKLYADQSRHGGWSDDDFRIYRSGVESGRDQIRGLIELNAAFIYAPAQRRQAVAMFGTRPLSATEKTIWAFVVRNWINDKKDPNIAHDLLTAGNTDVASLASAEIKSHESPQATAQ